LPSPEHDWDLDFVVSPHLTRDGQGELEATFGALIATEASRDKRIFVGDIPDAPHPMTKANAWKMRDLSGPVTPAIRCCPDPRWR
jgi:hypothetical protein